MMQNKQTYSIVKSALDTAFPQTAEQRRVLLTVKQFPLRNPAFSESALRNLIFKADERHSTKSVIPGNGLIQCGALVRIGRKVLIDEARFFSWIDAQGEVD